MLAEILKKSFDHYFDAPIEAWIEFSEFCEPVAFEKDQIIKSQGTAEKRYRILQAKFPNIHQQIAQKHIASYLGITPQSLKL